MTYYTDHPSWFCTVCETCEDAFFVMADVPGNAVPVKIKFPWPYKKETKERIAVGVRFELRYDEEVDGYCDIVFEE